jgi:hypothetical protein
MADLDGKASIGNYKGVMLCNRPNEFGQVQKPERQGKPPFISRVDPKGQVGLNPGKKIINVPQKKKDNNSILTRHKRYLKMLQEKKLIEKLETENKDANEKKRFETVRDQTAKQRQKIKNLKSDEPGQATNQDLAQDTRPVVAAPYEAPKSIGMLTKENLDRNDDHYSQKAKPSKAKRPAWAKTEDQLKKEQDEEIDDLIEFAYDLDYEKYMEDLEVRQALALIKERVDEIKKDDEWRNNIAQEWNTAEQANPNEGTNKRKIDDDARSAVSIRTSITGRSNISKKSEIMNQIQREEMEHKENWDSSTVGEKKKKPTAEEKLASRLADQIMEANPNLKNVHSKTSMKKMLEAEAAKQLGTTGGGVYQGPKVATVKDHEMNTNVQASNLPYLHKNPAI